MRIIAGAAFVILQLQNKLMGLGLFGSIDQVCVAGISAPIANVITRRTVEQGCFLRHHTYLASQAFLSDRAQVMPIYAHRAFFCIVKPQQQRHQC